MSRGYGAMQRDILQALDGRQWAGPAVCACDDDALTRLLCFQCPTRARYRDSAGRLYAEPEVCSIGGLRSEVARLRGAWCETDCYAQRPWFARPRGPHRPHPQYWKLGSGFAAAFSRAISTLITRGALVHVFLANTGSAFSRRQYVARGKC
jgi:hypothetical protein